MLDRDYTRYPKNFRRREVKQIAHWINTGESGSVIGLDGVGKSNLLRFLTNYPTEIQNELPANIKVALIYVDLNNLPDDNLATLYLIILRSIHEAGWQFTPDIRALLEERYRKVEATTNSFLCQSALREILFVCREHRLRLVLILDPFDSFCANAPRTLLDNLRGLRDSFKSTLTYLVGLRQEIIYLRNRTELGELYSLLDAHCWVGPMSPEVARVVLRGLVDRYGQDFSEAQQTHLLDLTGGHIGLMRAALRYLGHQSRPAPEGWLDLLLKEAAIQYRLERMWVGLTAAEQDLLRKIVAKPKQKSLKGDANLLNRLVERHLCEQIETGWQIFSPMLAQYIAELKPSRTGRITYDAKKQQFYQGDTKLTELTPKDNLLLKHFVSHPQTMIDKDKLIEVGWPDDVSTEVTNEMVQQAIYQLRKKIEPDTSKPRYLITRHGQGYEFSPDGAPAQS